MPAPAAAFGTGSAGPSGGPTGPSGRAAPGTTIGGRYALRAAVGTGGMGAVWRASDTLLRRDVAVKEVVLPPGLAPSDQQAMYERTMREARAAAALSHPAVVQVYDVVTQDGRPWIVMELLDARSLADLIIEDGPLAPRAVAKIGIALLGALEVAHAAGVLHRDVKPANVLICADGRCVLTDFGVARMPTDIQLTTPGMVLGSPHFISPERAMGGAFGPPSDLFSLGVTLYTAVEGRPPFDRGDPIETMHAVVEDPPAPALRAGPLTNVLHGLLEKDPARRWDVPTARTMLRDLLAGPLASRAPAHLMTDPYAVVPSQRPPWHGPAEPTPPRPTGQVGGRAMLAAHETPAARLRGANGSAAEDTAAGPRWDAPTGQAPWPASAPYPDTPGRAGGKALGGTLRGIRRGGLAGTVRGWSRAVRVSVAAALVAAVTVGVVVIAQLGGDRPSTGTAPPPPEPTPSATASAPIAMQEFADRGLAVNVPQGWKKAAPRGGVYVDFTDPADNGRRVRILVERSTTSPERFLQNAESRMSQGKTSCAAPYGRLELRQTELAGQSAAELEYTCGAGADMRHGIWRALVQGGRAYSFYLTVPEDKFAESRAIYDEMVRTFRLTGIPAG